MGKGLKGSESEWANQKQSTSQTSYLQMLDMQLYPVSGPPNVEYISCGIYLSSSQPLPAKEGESLVNFIICMGRHKLIMQGVD